jgi:hypothetical protein
MDRFLTFMVEGMIVLGGIGGYAILEILNRRVFDTMFRNKPNMPVAK